MDFESQLEKIAKDIRDREDREMALAFTNVIGPLLRDNGVVVKTSRYEFETDNETDKNKYIIKKEYGVSFDGLDFTEHDKRFKDEINQLESELSDAQKSADEYYNKCIDLTKQVVELESELEAKDNDSKCKDTEDYIKYNQMTSGIYGLLFNKYKGMSRNDVILKFSEFINTLEKNYIKVYDEKEGFVIEIKDDSLRNNDEIASLKKQIEKLESIRARCHKSAMDSFDLGMYEFLHIVTADELKTTKDVNDRMVELPFDALETANMLINATYKAEIPFLEKQVDRDVYNIDDLEQIAEHLLLYCKHHIDERD